MSPALPRMTPTDFLRQLPEAQDLPDRDECPVCLQKYVSATAPAPGIIERILSMAARRDPEPIETEHAVRLPCQHVLGSKCIKRWISPTEGDQNTCPYCVQQLFTPLKYIVSEHPSWNMLIAILGGYGFTMDPNGTWLWDQMQGAAALSSKDIRESRAIAKKDLARLETLFGPDKDTMTTIQRIAASRLTVHLRLTVVYLQVQKFLPPLQEVNLKYPFVTLEKHQEDALFDQVKSRTGGDYDRKVWDSDKRLGLIPGIRWEGAHRYYWAFA